MNKEEQPMEVAILGRKYPLKASDKDKTVLIELEQVLNHQLKEYKLKYEQLDNQDCLSMALIENHLISTQKDAAANISFTQEIEKKLLHIDQLLSDILVIQ
jgi:cell division protein ZapA (FtsZ GTPase activity inhibitor)